MKFQDGDHLNKAHTMTQVNTPTLIENSWAPYLVEELQIVDGFFYQYFKYHSLQISEVFEGFLGISEQTNFCFSFFF